MAVSPSVICTPALPNLYPCIKCLSKKELLQALATVLYAIGHQTGSFTADDMEDDAKCFECLNEMEMLQAIVNCLLDAAIDLNYFDASTDLTELNGCIKCMDPKIIQAVMVHNICLIAARLTNAQ